MSTMTEVIARHELQRALSDSKPTLVEFYSSACIHCQHMIPIINELKANQDGKANIVQIDGQNNPDLCEEYKVRHFPSWIIFKDGEKYWHDNGEKTLAELTDMLERVE